MSRRLDNEDKEQLSRALAGLLAYVAIAFAVLVTAWILGTAFRIFVETAGLR